MRKRFILLYLFKRHVFNTLGTKLRLVRNFRFTKIGMLAATFPLEFGRSPLTFPLKLWQVTNNNLAGHQQLSHSKLWQVINNLPTSGPCACPLRTLAGHQQPSHSRLWQVTNKLLTTNFDRSLTTFPQQTLTGQQQPFHYTIRQNNNNLSTTQWIGR